MKTARKLVQNPSESAWLLEVNDETNSPVDDRCIGLADNLSPEAVLHLATDLGFKHICQKDGHEFEIEMRSADLLVGDADALLNFPVASILCPDDLSSSSERRLVLADCKFDRSSQKREVLDQLIKASKALSLAQSMIDDVVAVADEMFTNSVFNAPFVDIATQKSPGIDRHTANVQMDGGRSGRLLLAHSESRLLVCCVDPYGSLNLQRYLNKINATYTRGAAATMNFGPGGAGIGSYIIFNAGSSLYFGVWPGQATVVACVIPLGLSNRKRIQLPKHLHWIQR